jgi:hypothetical protein
LALDETYFLSMRYGRAHASQQDPRLRADDIVGLYLDWLDREPPEDNQDDGGLAVYGYRPRQSFGDFAAAATFAGAWLQAIEKLP